MSPSTVSNLNKKIYGTIETWRNRPIEGEQSKYWAQSHHNKLLAPKLRGSKPVPWVDRNFLCRVADVEAAAACGVTDWGSVDRSPAVATHKSTAKPAKQRFLAWPTDRGCARG